MNESLTNSNTFKSPTNELQLPIETHNVSLTTRLLASRIFLVLFAMFQKNRDKMRARVAGMQLTYLANVAPYADKLPA